MRNRRSTKSPTNNQAGTPPVDGAPLVPFGPIDFDDPEWWRDVDEHLPKAKERKYRRLRGRTEKRLIEREREARALSILVLAKARRILTLEQAERVPDPSAPALHSENHAGRAGRNDPSPRSATGQTPPPPKPTQSTESTDTSEIRNSGLADWVQYRFREPLIESARTAESQSRLLLWLSSLTALLGVGASSFAVAGGGKSSLGPYTWVAAACGVLVAGIAAVIQIRKPGQRSVANYQLAHMLRGEGWDFVSGRGLYRGRAGSQALDLFVDEVRRIERTAELFEETPGDVSAKSTPASSSS
ncbi:MAG TPA: hypothetical protein VMB27_07725 [Solirubrobacteraceae bacterium]|nr:hypothetical protein [Solirubrobacteraceae bacterium]